MSCKKIYMSFNIKRHIHARVIFRCKIPQPTTCSGLLHVKHAATDCRHITIILTHYTTTSKVWHQPVCALSHGLLHFLLDLRGIVQVGVLASEMCRTVTVRGGAVAVETMMRVPLQNQFVLCSVCNPQGQHLDY